MLIKSDKKQLFFLCEFNNSNFQGINEIYKNLIKTHKFWDMYAILKIL